MHVLVENKEHAYITKVLLMFSKLCNLWLFSCCENYDYSETKQHRRKKKKRNRSWEGYACTIALVLKANVLISCPFDVISFTSSLNDSICSSLTLPVVASTSAPVSSSLSFCTVHTSPYGKEQTHQWTISQSINTPMTLTSESETLSNL